MATSCSLVGKSLPTWPEFKKWTQKEKKSFFTWHVRKFDCTVQMFANLFNTDPHNVIIEMRMLDLPAPNNATRKADRTDWTNYLNEVKENVPKTKIPESLTKATNDSTITTMGEKLVQILRVRNNDGFTLWKNPNTGRYYAVRGDVFTVEDCIGDTFSRDEAEEYIGIAKSIEAMEKKEEKAKAAEEKLSKDLKEAAKETKEPKLTPKQPKIADLHNQRDVIQPRDFKTGNATSSVRRALNPELTNAQIQAKNGEVKTVLDPKKRYSWDAFKLMDKKLQESYISYLMKTYVVGVAQIAEIMGISDNSLRKLIKDNGLNIPELQGKRIYATEDAKEKFFKSYKHKVFVRPEEIEVSQEKPSTQNINQPTITRKQINTAPPMDNAGVEPSRPHTETVHSKILAEKVKVSATPTEEYKEMTKKEETTLVANGEKFSHEEETKGSLAKMELEFHGPFNHDIIMNMVEAIIAGSETGTLKISFEK